MLWAVLAFITNYIPNVGFLIGLVPPALLALLTLGLPRDARWSSPIYCVLNFVIQSLIQPRYVGDSVGLATTTTFVALVFWAWLLGPLGALLAIPLTLLVKALLVDVDPAARWANALAGSLAAEPRPPRRHRVARTEAPVAAAAPRVPAGLIHPARRMVPDQRGGESGRAPDPTPERAKVMTTIDRAAVTRQVYFHDAGAPTATVVVPVGLRRGAVARGPAAPGPPV